MQCTHLVVHERNERRHHDGDAPTRTLTRNGGDLVTQRLAATRGHEYQGIAAVTHMVYDLGLWATKCAVPKHFTQDVLRIYRRGHSSFRGAQTLRARGVEGVDKSMKALLSLLLTMAG